MKKVLALAVAMLLIPFTAFGLEMMSDSDMESITGQSGVAISLDNIQLYQDSAGSELWFETALNSSASLAAVGLVYEEGSARYLFLNKVGSPFALRNGGSGYLGVSSVGALAAGANDKLRGNYEPLRLMFLNDNLGWQGTRNAPSVLSIRVVHHHANGIFGSQATLDAVHSLDPSNADYVAGRGAHIEIGLPTIEIYTAGGSADIFSVYVLSANAYNGGGPGPVGSGAFTYSLGTLYTSDDGGTTTILGGRLGITSFGQLPAILTNQGDL